MKNLSIILLSAFAGALLTMMLMRSHQPETIEVRTTDTLMVEIIDTITIERPVPYKVMVRDTISLTDTIYMGGQILFQEIKEYKDSTYYARISGINAFLEEIRVFPRTVTNYINTTEKVYIQPLKWSIGLQGGYGITPKGLQPYIGVGFSYQLKF